MKTIELTDEQYKVLQDMLLEQGFKLCEETKAEIKKWKPKPRDFYVEVHGRVTRSTGPNQKLADFGMYYPTVKMAEKASASMRAHNRLLVWLSENNDGWVADWNNQNQGKYYVRFNVNTGEYLYSWAGSSQILGVVYMSWENAHKLCDLLNEGLIEL